MQISTPVVERYLGQIEDELKSLKTALDALDLAGRDMLGTAIAVGDLVRLVSAGVTDNDDASGEGIAIRYDYDARFKVFEWLEAYYLDVVDGKAVRAYAAAAGVNKKLAQDGEGK